MSDDERELAPAIRPMPMGSTLKDVAERAGVSIKTVSNVVNGYEHVTARTRARVQAALDELNYLPNLSARFLRKARVGILALAIPDLRSQYFGELADAVIAAARERGYTVLIDQTNGERENELRVAQGFHPHLLDGVILSPLSLENDDLLHRKVSIPLVLLGERTYDAPFDHVGIDNIRAARTATEHLLRLGRRRIAAIGIRQDITGATARLRLQGYREALEAAGYEVDPGLVMPCASYHSPDGAAAMSRLLDLPKPPDAVFCFNDLLAIGALRALYERGVRVPDDIAVVGFDDIESAQFTIPSLTTIDPNRSQIAQIAVARVLGRAKGALMGPPLRESAEFRLVVRESASSRVTLPAVTPLCS